MAGPRANRPSSSCSAVSAQQTRAVALHRSTAYDENARQLGRLFLVFRIGLIVLVVEVAAWVVALAERA
jgi:hypothetical protein